MATGPRPAEITVGYGWARSWFGCIVRDDLLDALITNTGPNAYRRPDGIGVVPLALMGP